MNRLARDRSGQGLMEMALVLPILLLMILGGIEFFRAFNVRHVVTDAAREGARQAVVQDPSITQDSVVATIALALARASIPPASATITFDTDPPPTGHWRETGAMQTVFVSVPYTFGYLAPLVNAATGSSTLTIAARISMRNE